MNLTKRLFKGRYIVLLALLFQAFISKAALNPGDIAVIGYNSDGATSTKDFAVVVLTRINSGETIYVTDKGWTATAVDLLWQTLLLKVFFRGQPQEPLMQVQ